MQREFKKLFLSFLIHEKIFADSETSIKII